MYTYRQPSHVHYQQNVSHLQRGNFVTVKDDSHIACCAHAVLLPCRAAKGLECLFLI